jgi:hypothetical protein
MMIQSTPLQILFELDIVIRLILMAEQKLLDGVDTAATTGVPGATLATGVT